jgi:kinesin family protein 5
MTSSTLYLVDLAGSERVKKSNASASRLDEAKKINFSLSALGNCIHALTEKKATHVPFRDSKLTRLLQDSLGGNSKTSMILNMGPSIHHADETLMSLHFGFRAMKVLNKPTMNKKVDYKVLCI